MASLHFVIQNLLSEAGSAQLGSRCRIPQARHAGYNCPYMKLQVECYSGYKAEERPVIFRIDGHEYRVEEVLDQWYGPADAWFKVRAHDGNLYILRRRTCVPHSEWDLVSFRQAAG